MIVGVELFSLKIYYFDFTPTELIVVVINIVVMNTPFEVCVIETDWVS